MPQQQRGVDAGVWAGPADMERDQALRLVYDAIDA